MDKFCVIGEKLPHTLSPEIHKLFGLDYSKCELSPDELENFVKNGEYKAFNVTVPYKKTVMPFLDEISEKAKEIGAVNTVVRSENGKLFGYNTDYDGMKYSIEKAGIIIKDKSVIILGTGGTSNTAFAVCKTLGAKSIIKVGRTSTVNYENVCGLTETNVIINTTPVGTFPNSNQTPLFLGCFKNLEGVFDVVYNPLQTEFVRHARQLGVKATNGLRMLVTQAGLAENLFLGNNAITFEKIEKTLDELYKSKRNIVLTGMPSCGKSIVGIKLATLMNRPLIDLDAEISKKAGTSIEQIFAEKGEPYFRSLENSVMNEYADKFGLIIATGGGAPMSNDFHALRRNGFVVYIKRDLKLLSVDGRPVSKRDGLEKIFAERKAKYEQADFAIENNGTVEQTAMEIIKNYGKNTRY